MTRTATNPQTGETVALIGGEWKPVSQTATNSAGAKAYLVGDKWHTSDGAAPAVSPTPTPATQPSRFEQMGSNPLVRGAYGLAEGATNMLTGMGASAVGGIEGINKLLSGGTVDQATERIRAIQEKYTYQPRTAEGETTARVAAMPVEYAGKGAAWLGRNSELARMTGTELGAEMIAEKIPEAIATIMGGRAGLNKAANRPNVTGKNDPYTQAQAVRESVANSGTIEAGRLANQYGIAIDPIKFNKSITNRGTEAWIRGNDKAEALTKANAGVPERALKMDVGISAETPLSLESINAARDAAGGSRARIQQIGALTDDGTVSQKIAGLQPGKIAGDAASQKAVAVVIDDVITQINNGMTGADVLRNIEQLRGEAKKTFNSGASITENIAQAKAKMGVSDALEGLLEQNLTRMSQTDPTLGNLFSNYLKDRTTQAKTYALEKLFDENTGKVDMAGLAKMTAEDNALTGPFADLGKIAGVSPESFHSGGHLALMQRTLARSGVPAAIGAGIGAGIMPFIGALPGAMTGAAVGQAASILGSRRIASPGYQKANAVPVDARPMRQALGYEKTPVGPEPLSLAPVGEPIVQPTPAGPMPQGRGLLGFADNDAILGQLKKQGEYDTTPQSPTAPYVEIPLDPRLRPLYERGGIPQEPQVPPVRSHNGTIDFIQEQPAGLTKYGLPESPTKLGYEGQLITEGVAPPMLSQAEAATPLRALITDEGAALPTALGMVAPDSALSVPSVRTPRTPAGGPTPTMWKRASKGDRVIPQESPLMSVEEMTADAVKNRAAPPQETVPAMGKTEYWQQKEQVAVREAASSRAAELEAIINNKYPIDGRKQAAAAIELMELQKKFGEFAQPRGMRGPQDAYGPNWQAGGELQMPIEKTFDPRITAAILGRK